MRGPFPLTDLRIDLLVNPNIPGIFALSNDSQKISFLGRADYDLRGTLKKWVSDYKFFWYEYAISPQDAFFQECRLFHKDKDNLENKYHPEKPESTKLKCPICGTD